MNPDLLALMFVRALLIRRQNNYKNGDKGPTHCPVCIFEDEYWLDEVMPHENNIIKGEDCKRGTV